MIDLNSGGLNGLLTSSMKGKEEGKRNGRKKLEVLYSC